MTLSSIVWNVDPIFFSIGDFKVAYYGLTWALAFLMGIWLFGRMSRKENFDPRMVDSAFIIMFLSTLIGARLGHCFFYDPVYYIENFWQIFNIREGGLASHGAAVGLLVGIWIFTHKWRVPYVWMLDRIGIVVAIGGASIRIGNLLNSEIYGTETSLPWGFVFVRAGEQTAMHPTQIYEALAYLVIFAVLAHMYWRTKISDRRGVMFGSFLIMLFGIRFLIESIKQVQVDFEQGMILNMGQWLSVPFIVAGVVILVWALRRAPQPYVLPSPQVVSPKGGAQGVTGGADTRAAKRRDAKQKQHNNRN